MNFAEFFSKAAQWTSRQCGRPLTFGLAVFVVLAWAIIGPMFNYSDTWQLVINTGTTIVTFLMVFLIQNTQNRDAAAVQLKLDELIRAHEGARNRLLTIEDLTEKELDQIKASFGRIAERGDAEVSTIEKVAADIDEAEAGIDKAEAGIGKAKGRLSRAKRARSPKKATALVS